MFKCKHKLFTLFMSIFIVLFVLVFEQKVNAIDSKDIIVKTKFLEELSGKNKFIFSVDIEKKVDGVIKEFFIEVDNKITPINTYQISDNKYIIIINQNTKSYDIENVKLGVNVVINRSQESIKEIATLSAKNENFRSSSVIGDPRLLYYNQNQIVLAVEIDDPWDMLKSVQSVLVYPELVTNSSTTFEIKYVMVSGELKQYVYIYLDGFPSNQPLKFNLSLLFQNELDDVSINKINKTFLYNFSTKEIIEEFVINIYSTLLKRNPTTTELKNNVQALINKTLSPSTLIINIVESGEFQNKLMSNGEFINRVYRVILNRDPDDDGKKYWVSEVKRTSRQDVLKQMLTCEEYVRMMNELGLKI